MRAAVQMETALREEKVFPCYWQVPALQFLIVAMWMGTSPLG